MSTLLKPIALLLAAQLCCQAAHAQNKAAGPYYLMTNGYTFEIPSPTVDTVRLEDPVTDEVIYKYIRRTHPPTTINGEKIFKRNEVTVNPAPHSDGTLLEQYVLKGLVPLFDQLPDDTYSLDLQHIVLDKTGKVAYYAFDGIRNCVSQHKTPDNINDAAIAKMKELMAAAPVFNTATAGGVQVACLTEAFTHTYLIRVKDRKWSFEKMK